MNWSGHEFVAFGNNLAPLYGIAGLYKGSVRRTAHSYRNGYQFS